MTIMTVVRVRLPTPSLVAIKAGITTMIVGQTMISNRLHRSLASPIRVNRTLPVTEQMTMTIDRRKNRLNHPWSRPYKHRQPIPPASPTPAVPVLTANRGTPVLRSRQHRQLLFRRRSRKANPIIGIFIPKFSHNSPRIPHGP